MIKKRGKKWLGALAEKMIATGPASLTRREVISLIDRITRGTQSESPLTTKVLSTLIEHGVVIHKILQAVPRRGGNPYPSIHRYIVGKPTTLQIALSLRKDSFFSHGTAAHLLGLPVTGAELYVNKEQSAKASTAVLTQSGIDLAFRNRPRVSNLRYRLDQREVVILNGKNTQNLGVTIRQEGPSTKIRFTELERTLVDLAVRPEYAGGVGAVLNCYRAALERLSIDTLVRVLAKLQHSYPYHQAIGFYLQKAGAKDALISRLKALPRAFDFYLVHGAKSDAYSTDWRLHYPAALLDPN